MAGSGARTFAVAVVAAVMMVAAGCTSEPEEEPVLTIRQMAETMIRDEAAPTAGVGDLTPTCPDVAAVAVGTAFECTATTTDQRIIQFAATIDDTGHMSVASTNLITGPALPSFERAAVDALNATVNSSLTYEAIDCGETSVVFNQETRVMVCALRDPHTEQIFDVSLTIDDIEARQFSLVVADQPRA